MCAASVLVIYESINTIINDAQYFTEKNTTKTLSEIDMSAFPISVMVITVVSKAILFFLCYRVKTPTMSALAEDHRNDVCFEYCRTCLWSCWYRIKIIYLFKYLQFFKVHLHIKIK